jgi:metal-responsive CopG/Arc/MetJ family transcriptional regulator
MKTAVSIPDEIFADAERLAKRMKRSRSEIFSRALAEYLARHMPDLVTEAMNQTLVEVNELTDPFTIAAGTRLLSRTEW